MNDELAAQLAARLADVSVVTTPDLFCSEIANALLKYIRAGSLTLELAMTRFEQCMGLVDSLVPERTLAPEALVAAARYQGSAYDMMYAVLARRSGATVITMDRRLARGLRGMEIETYCPLLEA